MEKLDKALNLSVQSQNIGHFFSDDPHEPKLPLKLPPSLSQALGNELHRFENSGLWTAIRRILPGQCLLCLASAKYSLCTACLDDLPCLTSHCYPYQCYRCAIPLDHIHHQKTDDTRWLECGNCLTQSPSFDQSLSAFTYAFSIDRLIYNFKHSRDLRLGKLLSASLLVRIQREVLAKKRKLPALIIPVPMHPSKKRRRGFNQAEFIAKHLSQELNIPTINAFKKIKATPDQHSLNRKDRVKNLKGCFKLHSNTISKINSTKEQLVDKNNTPIKHLAIVDDVMTTGATVNELSKLLKLHGVEFVEIWTLARTPKPRTPKPG